MRWVVLIVLSGCMSKNVPVSVEPNNGTAFIVSGAIVSSVGVVALSLMPTCLNDVCFVQQGVSGVVRLAVGIPLLLVGINRHNLHKEWRMYGSPTIQTGANDQLMLGWGWE